MCFARNIQQFSKMLCCAIFTIWLPLSWSRGHQLFWNGAGKDTVATKYSHQVVLTLTGGLRACTLCCCPAWELCRSFDPQLATVLMGTLKAFVLPVPPPAPGFRGLCLMPSSSLTSKILLGSSSTLQSTKVLHSGQRSSFRELTMPSRQRLQNVCWQGKTFAEASRRSKQTGHSNRSSKADSSIFFFYYLAKTQIFLEFVCFEPSKDIMLHPFLFWPCSEIFWKKKALISWKKRINKTILSKDVHTKRKIKDL